MVELREYRDWLARIYSTGVWDDQLSSQMSSYGKAVLEESVLDALIYDLEGHLMMAWWAHQLGLRN
jgi:hypothetical protein